MLRNDRDRDEDFMAEYEDAAREYKGKIYFSYINLDTKAGQKYGDFL